MMNFKFEKVILLQYMALVLPAQSPSSPSVFDFQRLTRTRLQKPGTVCYRHKAKTRHISVRMYLLSETKKSTHLAQGNGIKLILICSAIQKGSGLLGSWTLGSSTTERRQVSSSQIYGICKPRVSKLLFLGVSATTLSCGTRSMGLLPPLQM